MHRHQCGSRLFFSAALLFACSASSKEVPSLPSAPSGSVALGSTFSLAPNESTLINQSAIALTFVKVSGDSRCPTDMAIQCVWAGSVQLGLSVKTTDGRQDVVIETQPLKDMITVDRYVIQLVAVAPGKRTTDSIPMANYRATFRVTKR